MLDEVEVLAKHESTQIAEIAPSKAFLVHSYFSSMGGQVLSHMSFDGHHTTLLASRSAGSYNYGYLRKL